MPCCHVPSHRLPWATHAPAQVHLTNFWSPTWCAPSRAAFMSGRVPWEVGVTAGIMHPPPSELLLLPEALRAAGYRTALIGKNHMAPDRRAHPTGHPRVGHGLDHFCGFYGGACGYWADGRRGSWQCNGEPSAAAASRDVYTTDLITHEAVRVIEAHPHAPAASAGSAVLSSRASATTSAVTSTSSTRLLFNSTRPAASVSASPNASLTDSPAGLATVTHPSSLAPLPRSSPRLFLWVSWTAPHRPLEAHPEVLARMPTSLPQNTRVPHTPAPQEHALPQHLWRSARGTLGR